MFLGVPLLYAGKSLFPEIHKAHFLTCTITESIDMLTKRSTHVDQIFRSQSIHSQLSVAIFIAPRTHLGAQKCSMYEKKAKNGKTRVK